MATEMYKQLMIEYRKLAKRADQRLVRIERYAGKKEPIKGESAVKGMEKITSYAYRVAIHDISKWSGADAKRFNTNPPNTTAELKAKIRDIRKFLESETSTLRGVKNTYIKRVQTINEKYGTDFTWEQFAEFTQSKLFEKLDSRFYLGNVFTAIGVIQDNKKDIVNAMKNREMVHIQTEDDDLIVEDTVNEILKDYGKEVKKLFL